MIIVGTAEVNSSTGQVELIAPMGFNTAEGVRLSNFTGDTVTITGINGRDQSQEYLAPQTQMVYATANIGATPTVIGFTYTAEQIAANLLVEWSTDPSNDFLGTYPTALPTGITVAYGTSLVNSFPSTTPLNTVPRDLGIIPTTYGYVSIDLPAYQTAGIAAQLIAHIYEDNTLAGCDVWVLAALQPHNVTTVTIPIQVSHIGASVTIAFAGASNTGYSNGAIRVYSTPSPVNVPLGYTDILTDGLQYISTTAGFSNSVLNLVPAATSGTANPYPAGLTKYLGLCDLTLVEYGPSAFTPLTKAALVTAQAFLSAVGNATDNETNTLTLYDSTAAMKIINTNGNRDFYYATPTTAGMSMTSNTRLFIIPTGGYPAGYAGTVTVTVRPRRSPYATTDVF